MQSTDDINGDLVQTAIDFREAFQREIAKKFNRSPKVVKKVKHFGRWVGMVAMQDGPFEENDEYFEYGILDLMYDFSFRVAKTARPQCFEEIITAVRDTLENSTAGLLRVKAIDLHRKIIEIGRDDRVEYGYKDDYEIIEKWVEDHSEELELPQNSKR